MDQIIDPIKTSSRVTSSQVPNSQAASSQEVGRGGQIGIFQIFISFICIFSIILISTLSITISESVQARSSKRPAPCPSINPCPPEEPPLNPVSCPVSEVSTASQTRSQSPAESQAPSRKQAQRLRDRHTSHTPHVRRSGPNTVVKLRPHIRAEPLTGLSQSEIESLRPFLHNSVVLCKQEFYCLPYILALGDERTIASTGNRVYVRGFLSDIEPEYSILRPGRKYFHPTNCEELGFEAEIIGELSLECVGANSVFDTSAFIITESKEAIETNSRLYPKYEPDISLHTFTPEVDVPGYILDVKEGLDYTGRNQVVIISMGYREGVSEGSVLEIYQSDRSVTDKHKPCKYYPSFSPDKIKLPGHRVGRLWVYKSCEKLSLALVVEAVAPIRIHDTVGMPDR